MKPESFAAGLPLSLPHFPRLSLLALPDKTEMPKNKVEEKQETAVLENLSDRLFEMGEMGHSLQNKSPPMQ